jgi:ATP-dependent RNA circularization protein (DNA/RNA ligase family)
VITMSGDFLKFPATPHLIWLGQTVARADKVLTRPEAEAFLRTPVSVEEKVDGANLGIGFDAGGNLLAQNRGNLVQQGTKGQFARLWTWLSERELHLFDALEDRFILFGEWCYARHSIHYTRLPDFFLAFDVFDRREQRFMSTPRRNELAAELKIATVPRVGDGSFSLAEVLQLISQSSLYDGPMEGIYLRQEDTSWLLQRAKVVRAEFVQQIGDHWSKQPLVPNRLLSALV